MKVIERGRSGVCLFAMLSSFVALGSVATAGSWSPLHAQQVTTPEAITLDEAIARAVERSPQYAQSTAALRSAEGSRRTTLGSFLPSMSLSSGASTRSQNQFDPTTQRLVSGSANSYNASVSASATIFEGGRRFAEWDQAAADINAAQARREDSRFGVVLQTQTLFFNALRQAELLEVQTSRVARAVESLDNIPAPGSVGSGDSV